MNPIRKPSLWLALALGLLLDGGVALGQGQVDFHRDVWPLISERCLACHGPNKVKGGLRLDSRPAAEAGGHLGQNLLREPRGTNDLLRRIATAEPAERMPLEGEPLTNEEIAVLTLWIEQGAAWPDETARSSRPRYAPPPQSWFDRWLPYFEQTQPPLYAGLAVMLGLLVIQRARVPRAGDAAATAGRVRGVLARVPRWSALVGLLLAVVWGLALLLADSQRELRVLQSKLVNSNTIRAATSELAVPRQVVAQHPPRLGGEYYRGNDERNPKLFNGGFYRTAKLNLHLVDGEGQPCRWSDPYPAEPKISLTIERAPGATPNLFSEKIISKVFLTSVQPVDLREREGLEFKLLQTLTPGEKWQIDFELPACGSSERLNGDLFLYSEMTTAEGKTSGVPNFRIDYDLHIREGKIEPPSRLSLVSLLQPGNLARIGPDRIAPSEWFDFRPIPEIEGEQTTDPVLLGITEHQEKERANESP